MLDKFGNKYVWPSFVSYHLVCVTLLQLIPKCLDIVLSSISLHWHATIKQLCVKEIAMIEIIGRDCKHTN